MTGVDSGAGLGDAFPGLQAVESHAVTPDTACIQANGIEAESMAVASTGAVGIDILTIDVTSSVLGWQANPDSNYGWALLTTTGFDGVDFYSAEGLNAPRLAVDVM